MTISNNPPHKTLELTEGESEAFEIFLLQRRKEAEQKFQMAQAQMVIAAGDFELCEQLLMKLRGEPIVDRHVFKTNKQKLDELMKAQSAGD